MIAGDNPIDALVKFLSVRPVGSKDKGILRQDLQLFQNIIGKLIEKDYDTVLRVLKEEDCELLLDYLHRFMQFVG